MAIFASNAIIQDISTDRNSTFITISYSDCRSCPSQTARLVANNNTILLDENENAVRANDLSRGMTIHALFSSNMTRSIPPQANAYFIQIIRRPASNNTTIGRIIDIDRQNRSFTTINETNLTTVIRFNVPEDARIFDRMGRTIPFALLLPGMRVRVRHADFMTASIPPQTTAFEIQIL